MSFERNTNLQLIEEMIMTARQEVRDNGFYYMLWGWLVFIAALGQYILLRLDSPYSPIVWLLMPLGAIVSIVYGRYQSKKERVKSYMDRVMFSVWIACGVVMMILIFSGAVMKTSFLPAMMLIYGIGCYISGVALRFLPLRIGAAFCWALAAVSFYLTMDVQLLMLALAVLASYIIPGHMLNRRIKGGE